MPIFGRFNIRTVVACVALCGAAIALSPDAAASGYECLQGAAGQAGGAPAAVGGAPAAVGGAPAAAGGAPAAASGGAPAAAACSAAAPLNDMAGVPMALPGPVPAAPAVPVVPAAPPIPVIPMAPPCRWCPPPRPYQRPRRWRPALGSLTWLAPEVRVRPLRVRLRLARQCRVNRPSTRSFSRRRELSCILQSASVIQQDWDPCGL